ncbi:MAG: ATPase, T2SS/T4P/T4SS family [Bacillota bacterium]|nr:ATPase, T2SS/T4P/T4SS family [Bacillota bacterium]
MINILYAILLLATLSLVFFLFRKKQEVPKSIEEKIDVDIYDLIDYVKTEINKSMRSNLKNIGLSEEAYKRQLRNRSKFMEALKKCIWGSDNDKEYVKDVIFDILRNGYINEEIVNSVISFENPIKLTAIDKFDILLYSYKKQYGKNALYELIKTYQLDKGKRSEDHAGYYYSIDEEDIHRIYDRENPYLNREDRIKVLSQRLYQRYKGFSVVDEIRDMNIDGLSGGVSGISAVDVMDEGFGMDSVIRLPRNYESVWIFFEGKSIHMSFLSFGSESELKRVCQNIYRYNSKGMLSEDVGYKISEMMDGSRVVVVRPDFSESWAFFVRKFRIKNIKLEKLITSKEAELPINMIRYLAKGGRITAITGSQGSGKTTLLMAMIGEIYSALTLRIQEMSFELHLRRLYPDRNILSFKETANISGQAGLDVQKKTDGSVNILGEVASDEVAAWMIQMAQVASLFTLFTHHAKRAEDLILSLRNSLLKCDIFRNEKVAEEQVVNVLNFDIHLKKDYKGNRYIERITEIIQLKPKPNLKRRYAEQSGEEAMKSFMEDVSSFFEYLSTDKLFEARDIIRYVDGEYKVVNRISKHQVQEMLEMMTEEDKVDFVHFLESYELCEQGKAV